MNDETDFNSVYVRLFIRGEYLNPIEVTTLLGIQPSYSYQRGDRYGKDHDKVRKLGLWSISSESFVESSELQVHLEWLLTQLEPLKDRLISITSKADIYAQISCVFSLFNVEWDEQIRPQILKRVAELNILFGISIYNLNNLEESLGSKR